MLKAIFLWDFCIEIGFSVKIFHLFWLVVFVLYLLKHSPGKLVHLTDCKIGYIISNIRLSKVVLYFRHCMFIKIFSDLFWLNCSLKFHIENFTFKFHNFFMIITHVVLFHFNVNVTSRNNDYGDSLHPKRDF